MLSLLLLAALAAGPEVAVTRLDGAIAEGPLSSLSPEAVEIAGEERIPLDDVQTITLADTTLRPLDDAATAVTLADGSQFAAASVTKDGDLAATLADDHAITAASRQVRAVRLKVLEEVVRTRWLELLGETRSDDLLVVRKGDTLDFIACVVGVLSDDAIAIRVGSRNVKVPRAKAFGLIFADAASPSRDAIARVRFADGSLFVASAFSLEDDVLTLTLPGVATGNTYRRPLADVHEFDFAQGRVVRLATLQPNARYERASRIFSGTRPVRVNRNVLDLPPRLEGRTDPSSVWMHSGTTATYPLPRGVIRLQARAGIDEIEGADLPAAPVDVAVRGDGRPLWSGAIEPGSVTAWDLPLDGVCQLTIDVDGRTPDGIREHLVLFGGRLITE